MSWFSKLVDKIRPERLKKAEDKLTPEWAKKAGAGIIEPYKKVSGGSAAPAAAKTTDIGNLPQEEMDKLVAQRMARLGKYYTSPSGTLNGNTGNAKVFS